MRLHRLHDNGKEVIGVLQVLHKKFFTLEPPWRDNESNVSCIPPGTYRVQKYSSQKYGDTMLLLDTYPRSAILIHAGNLAKNTRGCILIGNDLGKINGENAVLSSRSAMAEFRDLIAHNTFSTTTIRAV